MSAEDRPAQPAGEAVDADLEDFEDFALRPGQLEDLDELCEVYRASAGGPGLPEDVRSAEEVRAWLLALLDLPGRELWVAAREEVLLGFVLIEEEWIDLLYVHPERPAAGVGAALLDLVKGLRPRGFGLRVHRANTRARAFYARRGLVELEHTDGSSYPDGTPDVAMAWPGEEPLAYLRGRIDLVDDELAVLLARRTALTAAVQDHKLSSGAAAGEQGRDAGREAEIVARMAQHVPGLGADRIARVMHTIIKESLAAWEAGDRPGDRPGEGSRDGSHDGSPEASGPP